MLAPHSLSRFRGVRYAFSTVSDLTGMGCGPCVCRVIAESGSTGFRPAQEKAVWLLNKREKRGARGG